MRRLIAHILCALTLILSFQASQGIVSSASAAAAHQVAAVQTATVAPEAQSSPTAAPRLSVATPAVWTVDASRSGAVLKGFDAQGPPRVQLAQFFPGRVIGQAGGIRYFQASPTFLPASPAPDYGYADVKLNSAYSGPLYQLRRSSDSATRDVYPGVNGQVPDYAADDAWASGGGTITMLRYDQWGGTGLETQATVANRPQYIPGNRQRGFQPATALALGTRTDLPSFTTDRQAATLVEVASWQGYAISTLGIGTSGTNTNNLSTVEDTGHAATLGNAFTAWNYGPKVEPTVIINKSGAAATGRVDYRRKSVTAQTALSLTGGGRMFSSANGFLAGQWGHVYASLVYLSALSDTNEALVGNALLSIYQVPVVTDQVVFVGDSNTYGTGSETGRSIAYQMAPNLSKRAHLVQMGRFGATYASITNPTSIYDATAFPGSQQVVNGTGTNDLGLGTSAATLEGTATTWINARKSTGFKLVMVTIPPRYDGAWTGAMETERLTYNSWLISNAGSLGYRVADVASISQFSTCNLTYYATDCLHFRDAGQALMEAVVRPQVEANF